MRGIVLSGQTNKKCIKGQAFWRRVGFSLYETTLGLLLISEECEEWLVGRDERPKRQYGSVKLEISNWRKSLVFNKTLKAGERYVFCKVSR